ncbi:MAG TPA: sigma factor [Acidimicrobiales bacterium]|nr:sigma factor [Acidimicrobiales bacterium]
MSGSPAGVPGQGPELLALYDRGLPEVYGYLLRRRSDSPTAEDLTSETFLTAAALVSSGVDAELNTPWLIGVARHKLVDHWRRQERQPCTRVLITDGTEMVEDPWDVKLDAIRAQAVLGERRGRHGPAGEGSRWDRHRSCGAPLRARVRLRGQPGPALLSPSAPRFPDR